MTQCYILSPNKADVVKDSQLAMTSNFVKSLYQLVTIFNICHILNFN